MTVADIGAGTGLLTRDLLPRFAHVFAVEPNEEMRSALVSNEIGSHPSLRALSGTAESTSLADSSVDMVFAAQAFHWFDIVSARAEFQRVLRGPRAVALFWNTRKVGVSRGADELDAVMDSLRTGERKTLAADEAAVSAFFGAGSWKRAEYPNPMSLSRDELRSMVLSRSYAPRAGDSGYEGLVTRLDTLFGAYSIGEHFVIPQVTEVYLGRL